MSLVRREMTRAVVAGDFRGFFGLVGRNTEFQDGYQGSYFTSCRARGYNKSTAGISRRRRDRRQVAVVTAALL
jgi:hypothetical protein